MKGAAALKQVAAAVRGLHAVGVLGVVVETVERVAPGRAFFDPLEASRRMREVRGGEQRSATRT